MFYAQFVLSKKGPLAQIWLAAHWEKKLSKAQIYETSVQDAVAEIIQPKVRLSLRTTGHLLLGIVRIYSRKAKYVLADCNEAFLKLKMAFKHGGANDLALRDREDRTSINDTAEVMTDFYENLPEINDLDGPLKEYQANQCRIDDITLKEDKFGRLNCGLDFVADQDGEGMDDFGEKKLGQRSRSGSMFNEIEQEVERHRLQISTSSPGFNRDFGTADELDQLFNLANDMEVERDGSSFDINKVVTPLYEPLEKDDEMEVLPDQQQVQSMEVQPDQRQVQSINDLSFQLEPIEQLPHQERIRQKRKRKLIVDEQKQISGEEMKANMADYSDTLRPLDLAPPTKELMRLKENYQLEKMLSMPSCKDWLLDPRIIQFYQSHLELHAYDGSGSLMTDELHRDLEMAATIEDDDRNDELDMEFLQANTPFNENVENIIPPEMVAPKEGDEIATNEITSPGTAEKRPARRSRVHEEDEDEVEEEEFFTRKTKNVLHAINTKLRSSEDDKIVFDDLLTKGSTRRTAAQKFYALLELKKRQAIEIEQAEPYGPIEIAAGPRMQEAMKLQV